MTVEEAAKLIGITPSLVRRYCRAGRILAERQGRDWWIEEWEARRFAAIKRAPGRKKTPTGRA